MFNKLSHFIGITNLFLLFIIAPNNIVANSFHYDKNKKANPKSTAVFIENKGQWSDKFQYRLNKQNVRIHLQKDRILYQVINQNDIDMAHQIHHKQIKNDNHIIHGHNYTVRFRNMSEKCEMIGLDKVGAKFNYFIGDKKENWGSDCNGFGTVIYKNIYEGIDMQLYILDNSVKYDFIVKPFADVAQIEMVYDFIDEIKKINEALNITTSAAIVTEKAPFAYQYVNNTIEKVACNYRLKKNELTYHLPNGYDESKNLIIDPELVFATYTGAGTDNWGFTATYDNDENMYAGGIAFGDYPTTPGAFQTSNQGGGQDISISKFSADGSTLVYSTYIGGNGNENPFSLIVNNANNLVIFGNSNSIDYPTTSGVYNTTLNGGTDLVITILNAAGNNLIASTFIGGSIDDGIYQNLNNSIDNYGDENRGEVVVDASDNVYVCSSSRSDDFPVTAGSFNTTFGGGILNSDAVVFKMNPNLSSLTWSGFLGGSSADGGFSITLDASNNAYVTGTCRSAFQTTAGSLSPIYSMNNSNEGFIAQIAADGSQILAATFLPGSDFAYFVDTDDNGDVFVAGQSSTNIYSISPGVYNNPGSSTFLQKLSPDLSTSLFSTVLGKGSLTDQWVLSAFLVDNCNRIYLCGWGGTVNSGISLQGQSLSGMPITSDAFQSTTDGSDFYLMVLEPDAVGLEYSTFLGGNQSAEHVDGGTSRFDKKGIVYQAVCAGCGGNSDFPTTVGAYSNTNNANNCNLAAFKFDAQVSIVEVNVEANPGTIGCPPLVINFDNLTTGAISYIWDFGDNTSSTDAEPTHSYNNFGTYEVMLIALPLESCLQPDTDFLEIQLVPDDIITVTDIGICDGDPAELIASVSNLQLDYIWNDNITTDTSISITVPGKYWVKTTGNGCDNIIDSFNVDLSYLQANLSTQNIECILSTDGIITAGAVGNSPPFTYALNGMPAQTNNIFDNLTIGTYSVTVTDDLLCEVNETVTISSSNVFGMELGDDIVITYPEFASLNPIIDIPTTEVRNVIWTNLIDPLCDTCFNQIVRPDTTTLYTIYSENAEGCIGSDTITVFVKYDFDKEVYIPNVFTPNEDGRNDFFNIQAEPLAVRNVNYLRIYNRWGENIYTANDFLPNTKNAGWNGKYHGKELNTNVFVYVTEVEFIDRSKCIYKGNVTLLK